MEIKGTCMTSSPRLSLVAALLFIVSLVLVFYTYVDFEGFGFGIKPQQEVDWRLIRNLYDSRENRKTGFSTSVNRTAIKNVRLLCLILTREKDLATKVSAVNDTWVGRCDKHFYILSTTKQQEDFLSMDVPDNRNNLVRKIMISFETVYDKYINEFDWILKADDDTYIVVENLKFLLSNYNPKKPGYLGYHFNHFTKYGYMSGGAGYVISNSGLRHLVENGYRKGKCELKKHSDDPENSEDVETARCLSIVKVPILSSLDIDGRETFHPYTPEQHVTGTLPGYIYSWAKHYPGAGDNCCSRYVISFHYMSPGAVYMIDFLLYKTTVFGLEDPDIQLNTSVFQIAEVNK